MRRYEDYCVSCPKEIGCLGTSCPYMNVPVDYCDNCGEHAVCNIDGEDYCEECATKYLQDLFDNLSLAEKAEMLEVSFEEINN